MSFFTRDLFAYAWPQYFGNFLWNRHAIIWRHTVAIFFWAKGYSITTQINWPCKLWHHSTKFLLCKKRVNKEMKGENRAKINKKDKIKKNCLVPLNIWRNYKCEKQYNLIGSKRVEEQVMNGKIWVAER